MTRRFAGARPGRRAWIEAVAIPLIALLLTYALRPQDPFLFKEPFPWLWLAPALVALRYGLGPGVLSTAVLVLAFAADRVGALVTPAWPEGQFLGGFVLTLLCGEYGSTWMLRLRRAEQQSEYADQQLEGLTRTLHITRLSHDRLEQSVISKPVTLRDSLADLRQTLVANTGTIGGVVAERLLHLAAYHGGFERAALYRAHEQTLDPAAAATIGIMPPLAVNDVLVSRCLTDQVTTYWAVNTLEEGEQSDYLVAVPARAADGTLIGLLVVAEMPFLFLTEENLLAVSVLLAYFADEVWAARACLAVTRQWPDCPPRFAAEVLKLQHIAHALGLESTLVTATLSPHISRGKMVMDLEALARGLDITWRTERHDQVILVTLMPFSNETVAAGYIRRAQARLTESAGVATDPGGVVFRIASLNTETEAIAVLTALIGTPDAA